MTSIDRPIVLVGCGKMGGAMLDGWLAGGIAAAGVIAVDPQIDERWRARAGVSVIDGADDLPHDLTPAVVVLAVKPQTMDAAIGAYRRFAGPETLFLSIAAGKPIAYFHQHLGANAAVVRAMPNTPAAVGRGITVCCAGAGTSAAQKTMAGALLAAVGAVEWVDDEGLIDAVTAVSGGGPAYVFLLIEVLAEAGVAAGLPEDLAMRLARETVSGAGELARQSDDPASVLRQNVTSPGGTTAEALKVLMADDGITPLFVDAVAAATRRSRELAG
ncbi:MAG: pyrroline-5-carboxylate reductase [Alphaproteobacteria bacterium]|nr:pyrroline-5-carboxylate reductase [Alphaproteobacteria bacterium]